MDHDILDVECKDGKICDIANELTLDIYLEFVCDWCGVLALSSVNKYANIDTR